jgi:effector-binding domain-containing protein/ribosome-associated toxin RatA of RatAB toxin-antitoxin module
VATRPNDYDVARSKIIKAPVEVVFNNINDFKNWEAWGPWMEEDPSIEISYNEQTSGIGANYSWTSKDGPGKMKTKSLTQNKMIEQEMQFGDYEPTTVSWEFEEVTEGTKVTWRMQNDKTPFIFKLFAVLSGGMDKMLGEMEEKGLDNLDKVIAEHMKNNPQPTYRIGEVMQAEVEAKQFAGYYQKTSTEASPEEMHQLFQTHMPNAGKYGIANKLDYTPGTLYTKWDEETKEAEFYIGLLVHSTDKLPASEGLTIMDTPAGKVVKVSKFGPYGIGDMEAHMKIAAFMEQHKLVPAGPVWEQFENDPEEVKPEDIQTDIYYLVTAAE